MQRWFFTPWKYEMEIPDKNVWLDSEFLTKESDIGLCSYLIKNIRSLRFAIFRSTKNTSVTVPWWNAKQDVREKRPRWSLLYMHFSLLSTCKNTGKVWENSYYNCTERPEKKVWEGATESETNEGEEEKEKERERVLFCASSLHQMTTHCVSW